MPDFVCYLFASASDRASKTCCFCARAAPVALMHLNPLPFGDSNTRARARTSINNNMAAKLWFFALTLCRMAARYWIVRNNINLFGDIKRRSFQLHQLDIDEIIKYTRTDTLSRRIWFAMPDDDGCYTHSGPMLCCTHASLSLLFRGRIFLRHDIRSPYMGFGYFVELVERVRACVGYVVLLLLLLMWLISHWPFLSHDEQFPDDCSDFS